MGDFPVPVWPPFNTINTLSVESLGGILAASRQGAYGSSPVSGAPGSNLAMYIPFRLFESATAVKMTYVVGATSNGTADVGIYNNQKVRLVNSGNTAQGTINTIQEIDITDTLLTPGVYWMGIQLSSGTGTMFRVGNPDEALLGLVPMYDQAVGSTGLPNPAVWVLSTQGTVPTPLLAVHFDATV